MKHCWSIWICRGHCSRITKILLIWGDIVLCITSFVHDIISLWQIRVDVNSAVRFEMHLHWSLQAMMIPQHGICISAAQHFRFVGLLIFTSVKIIDDKIFTETLKCLYWLSEFVIYWQMKWRTCWPRPASVTTWYRLFKSTRASWTPRVSSLSRWPPTCSSFYSLEVESQRLTVDKDDLQKR